MKTATLVVLMIFSLFSSSCNEDDNEVQTLPEATQTGRGIFACYEDGKPFIDNSGDPNGISFNCYYQLIDGEYYFGIQGRVDNDGIGDIRTVSIGTEKKEIEAGTNYLLQIRDSGNIFWGGCFRVTSVNSECISTDEYYSGVLTITEFDVQSQIVSGTFWMNLQHPISGETVRITDGRFDTRFGL
jgi:hypothetical protein